MNLNFRKIFKKPIVISSIADLMLPFTIELRKIVLVVPTIILLYLVKNYVLFWFPLIQTSTITVLYYVVSLWAITTYVTNEHSTFDNKNVFVWCYDYLKYFLTIRLNRIVYTEDQPQNHLSKTIRFSTCKLKLK